MVLEEYRALRSETTQRLGSSMTLLAFLSAAAALIVNSKTTSSATWTVVAVLGAFLIVVWLSYLHMIYRLGRYLRTVEAKVNALAAVAHPGVPAVEVLGWEAWLANHPGWLRQLGKGRQPRP